MNKYGIENTHKVLYEKLFQYINSQYFGSSTLLQNAVLEKIKQEGVLYKEPYIEANKAYEITKEGISKSPEIPEHIKKFMGKMIENKLGVFQDPFTHQVIAMEKYFKGKDLFVATGTGSGKTECFMWPMIASIADEIITRKESWDMRGVRALLLYPMNALVSDQVGRLRKIIGDQNGHFKSILKGSSGNQNIRTPQFGMYTGRTPYPGDKNLQKDKKLADAIAKDILNTSDEIKGELKKLGKLPAKRNLPEFVQGLKRGEHITDINDAELITRFEMQMYCPDILITNYSMLEYMLIRQRESKIWEDTIIWLNKAPENKLLFVVDEAHMYRGSAGGEVALLIKRVMNRLGIDEGKIKFILTSASMPHETEDDIESIRKFACDFTSRNISENSYELIFGENEKLPSEGLIEILPDTIVDVNIDNLQGEDNDRIHEISHFANIVVNKNIQFKDTQSAYEWLYVNLLNMNQFNSLLSMCRGNAMPFEKLSRILFPEVNSDISKKATQVILAIATLARNREEKVLFPSRLHMFFRGLKGVYACTNPNCTHKTTYDGITIGQVFLDSYRDNCDCGGKIYELINHRRCGALFIKGYVDTSATGKKFLWDNTGILKSDSLKEIHLYIVNDYMTKKDIKDSEIKWIDSRTGLLLDCEKKDCLRVAYSTKKKRKKDEEVQEEDVITFSSCPKCSNRVGKRGLTDFATKGNIPFYNIVNAQLLAQPQMIFDEDRLKKFPNAGRKVLLFSDSRQRAAILAKDMTKSADDNAARQALVKAVIRLQNYGGNCKKDIDMLYPIFLQIACEDNVHFFYGSDEDTFSKQLQLMREKIEFAKETGKKIKYENMVTDFKNKPGLYIQQLLKLVCDNYQSLSDIALCWIESADDEYIWNVAYRLRKKNINLTEEEISVLVTNWSISVAKDSIALGEEIEDFQRESIQKNEYGRYGIKEGIKFQKGIGIALGKKGFIEEQIKEINEEIKNEFSTEGKGNTNKFLMTSKLALRYESEHAWYKCNKCSEVSAFSLWDICPCCGANSLMKMDKQDYLALSFWRKPVEEVIFNNDQIKSINTEEHTAQLSHKDQREEIWSTTENYEMRFQDIAIDKDMPVDVLSCTTTMEVGIDIGSLSAVALRNVPPMRENYQQRAGRAGRRNSSISTITTYAHNGPHDNWYFKYPDKIISGKVRRPWIDVNSKKLIKRHLYIIIFNDFLQKKYSSLDEISTFDFFEGYLEEFLTYLARFEFTSKQKTVLLTSDIDFNLIKLQLHSSLLALKEDLERHPEKYGVKSDEKVNLLDSLFNEGLLPTYSFPKNVVGFHIEDSDGKLIQKPDRSLDIAISEYAPGRTLVVDKKTYKSGGIYSHSSKFRKGENSFSNPAEAYFNDRNYYMPIYMCSDSFCDWFGTELPNEGICPFCGKQVEGNTSMLKPWGFAPENATSSRESEPDGEFSFAEKPCYSAPAKDDMQLTSFKNLMIANRYDEVITIINKGPSAEGFSVCKKCGAAVTGKDSLEGSKIKSPYNKRYKQCNHEGMNVVLGHSFRTDLLVLQIEIDPELINTTTEGLWLKSATTSLTEALKLSASRVLDVEFSDIKVGNRIRYAKGKVFIDIFIYDSLSSGAGYAFEISNCLGELFDETKKLLTGCSCETACHDCLKHYWNQKEQVYLNRREAFELLMWAMSGEMPKLYSADTQKAILNPVFDILLMDDPNSSVIVNNNSLTINHQNIRKTTIIIPAMYNKRKIMETERVDVIISEKLVKYALPKAYEVIVKG